MQGYVAVTPNKGCKLSIAFWVRLDVTALERWDWWARKAEEAESKDCRIALTSSLSHSQSCCKAAKIISNRPSCPFGAASCTFLSVCNCRNVSLLQKFVDRSTIRLKQVRSSHGKDERKLQGLACSKWQWQVRPHSQ